MSTHSLLLLKALTAAAVATSLLVVGYAAAAAPLGDGARLGLRGLKRQRAIESNELWRSVEPAVRWLAMRVSGLMSAGYKQRLNREIGVAGDFLGLLPEEVIGLSILCAATGSIAGWIAGRMTGMGSLPCMACVVFGAIAPTMQISTAAAARLKSINRRLPYAIDLLALSMGAGLDFPASVRQVIEKSGSADDPLVEEFTLILQGLQVGRTRRQTLEEFAQRVPTESVTEFAGAIVQAELRGNPVASVLRIQAEVSRQRRSVRAEESASKAGVAMIGPLMLVFVAILLLIVAPMAMRVQEGM
jgi:tight adherence protein C